LQTYSTQEMSPYIHFPLDTFHIQINRFFFKNKLLPERKFHRITVSTVRAQEILKSGQYWSYVPSEYKEPEGSFVCSEQLSAGPYPEPN
jgi:hypothetical protein